MFRTVTSRPTMNKLEQQTASTRSRRLRLSSGTRSSLFGGNTGTCEHTTNFCGAAAPVSKLTWASEPCGVLRHRLAEASGAHRPGAGGHRRVTRLAGPRRHGYLWARARGMEDRCPPVVTRDEANA